MITNLCIDEHVTGWRQTTARVTNYPGSPDWAFEVDVEWKTTGEFDFRTTRAVPLPDAPSDAKPPSKHVLSRVGRLIECVYGAGDLDPAIAFAAMAFPDPKYHPDEQQRAEAAATIHRMEHARYEMTREMGLAMGDRARPLVVIGKAFDIPFGKKNTVDEVDVVDEASPGHTVHNYVRLAKSLTNPATGEKYLPPQSVPRQLEPPAVKQGPHAGHEITLFCWRTPHRVPTILGQPVALGRVLGPDVVVEARWTDLKRHFEDRPDLPVIEPLRALMPADVPQRIQPIIRDIEARYLGVTVKAHVTTESTPPNDYAEYS